MITLYHCTTDQAARAIISGGFNDASGYYMADIDSTGVWFSDQPLDANEGAKGHTLLRVTANLEWDDLADYEWIEDEKPYREWQVPAALINAHRKALTLISTERALRLFRNPN